MVHGSWFMVQGSGFMVHGSGQLWFMVHGSRFMVHGSYAEGGVQQCWADDCGAGRKADGTMSVKYFEKFGGFGYLCYICTRKGISISKFILSTGLFVGVNL